MDKKTLRKFYIAKRKSYTLEELDGFTNDIVENLKSLDLSGVGSVFNSSDKMKEVGTAELISELKNIQWAYPKVNGNELDHYLINERLELGEGALSLIEPVSGDRIEAFQFDFVIVPLLICDKKGNRVGFGKGFYDRFLARCKPGCKFIGVNFFHPIESIEDLFEEDIPLDILVTPSEIFEFK